jgi:hypothetical protein
MPVQAKDLQPSGFVDQQRVGYTKLLQANARRGDDPDVSLHKTDSYETPVESAMVFRNSQLRAE